MHFKNISQRSEFILTFIDKTTIEMYWTNISTIYRDQQNVTPNLIMLNFNESNFFQ